MNGLAQTVGANVRRLRRTRGLSLVELGQHANVAKGTLTQLEAGRGNPTLETIQALGRALGVTVSDLVSEPADGRPLVVRADDAQRVPDGRLDFRLIHRSHTGGAITELYRLRVDPRRRSESGGHPHGVTEQVYVLEGTLLVGPVEAPVTVRAHDFAQFPADRPHAYEAAGGAATALVWMIYPSVSLDAGPFRSPTNGAVGDPTGPPAPPRPPARGAPRARRPRSSGNRP